MKPAVQELSKPSNDGDGSKQKVAASVPSKHGTSLFTDDDDADDLFASPAPSKVVDFLSFAILHYYIFYVASLKASAVLPIVTDGPA